MSNMATFKQAKGLKISDAHEFPASARAVKPMCAVLPFALLVSVTAVADQPTGAPGVPAAEKAIRWEPIGLGGGGAYMCIALAESDPKVIYVGGDVGGVWKSDDRGRSWQPIASDSVP